jgi:uncharacterized protein YbaP (TraB family)
MRTRHRYAHSLVALLLVFLSTAVFGQTSAYTPGSPILMWRVSSKTNSAYLLGSIHIWDKSMYPLPAVVENAFAASSTLIVEVDVTKVDHQQLQQLVLGAGMFPAGDDLNKHITAETRAKLNEFTAGYGVPPDAFFKYRPWMVGLTVVMLPMLKAGMDPENGMDMYFLHKAGDKRIEQLEDAAFQIKLFSSFPDKDADHTVLHALVQAKESNAMLAKLETYWGRGEATKIDELMASMSADDDADEKALSRRLREDRNPHMTERLEKCLQSGEKCFMVVGAAHTVGNEGIVKQLQAHGYRVEQAVVETSAKATK